MTNKLAAKLARVINATGPLSIAEYMHICMSDPQYGYYQTQTIFGEEGDFITSPEVSQMFGELIAVWCMEKWIAMGRPTRFNMVELGPGRGKLMSDLLRAAKTMPAFHAAAQIHLVETSPSLRRVQADILATGNQEIVWLSDISELSSLPVIFIANEFLDVLPIRQYVLQDNKWHERLIGLDDCGRLAFCLSRDRLPISAFGKAYKFAKSGAVLESSPSREAFIQSISLHLRECNGAGLFFDYGHAQTGLGETLQAIRKHEHVDILTEPGFSDLSSHVDFEALGLVAYRQKIQVGKIKSQGEFLLDLGLLERAGSLGKGQSPETQARLTREVDRLASPNQMGHLFKAFYLSHGVEDQSHPTRELT